MRSLELLADWPVDHVAAAIVAPDGTIAQTGDVDRVFDLASVTKLLVAYGVLVAVEEGAVELDDAAGPSGSTVRHLLAHASGLAFGERREQAEPGRKRIYSSAGYEVLADTVTAATDIAFPEYLTEAVFTPLGMASASLPGSAGHGGRASVRDLLAFVGDVRAPALLAAEAVAEATSVQFPGLDGIVPGYGTHKPNDWGLGFEIRGEKSPHWTGGENSPRTVGHFGQAGTFVWLDPVAEVAAIVLTDRAFGDWAKPLWPAFSDAVLRDVT
ncbi:serine hydrolase [Rhodococcus rhodnii]|uniref:Beta lactamase n=2 Tax=Rhodococcus rhodnii TaxID=38312 RepID=R7WLA4_9NOCA|nr:serine hydrolase domain-containing protein [Rhodococcus rhodnii]EOM76082.1 beta lactamase [Rhodococcus rhodnii LMG 5362]TXG91475.1 serine hydrolase [Rhodococcus rhodnii]